MKKIFVPLAAACLLSLLLSAPAGYGQASPTPTPPEAPPLLHVQDHSAIQAAISSLEKAKAEMRAASQDYGGHRPDAIAACDAAITQLKLALEYANQTPAVAGAGP